MPKQPDITLEIHSGMPIAPARDERVLPSFWCVQFAGWATFFLFVLLATLPGLKHPGTLFFGSCVLRPICRKLRRCPLSWLQVEARTLVWCLVVGPLASLVAEFIMMGFRRVSWGECLVVAVQFTIVLFLWCNLYLNAKYRQQAAQEQFLTYASREESGVAGTLFSRSGT
jgi:hypothetical protein